MSKRVTPAPGLSYVDANRGRLIDFQDDVLGYKAVIESRWPCLKVIWDTEEMVWCIVETDKNGTDSLVFTTEALGEHTMERLGRADNTRSDALEDVEAWNAKMELEQERRAAEAIHEVGEKLAWAIRKDEFNGPCPRIFFDSEKQRARLKS